jgi:hypothetical protein
MHGADRRAAFVIIGITLRQPVLRKFLTMAKRTLHNATAIQVRHRRVLPCSPTGSLAPSLAPVACPGGTRGHKR